MGLILSAAPLRSSYITVERHSENGCVTALPVCLQGDGGSVRAWGQADVTVIDSIFMESRASRGGAISVVGASLTASNTFFLNCTASDGGGAISIIDYQCYGASSTNTEVRLEGCSFASCHAPGGSGGAIKMMGSSTNIQTVSLRIISSSFTRYGYAYIIDLKGPNDGDSPIHSESH